MSDPISPSTETTDDLTTSWMNGLFSGAAKADTPDNVMITGSLMPEESAGAAYPIDHYASAETFAIDQAIARITPEDTSFDPQGYCEVIAPATSWDKMNEIENPLVKGAYMLPTAHAMFWHKAINTPLAGVAVAHDTVNVGIAETVTDNSAAQSGISGGLFAGEVFGISALTAFLKNRKGTLATVVEKLGLSAEKQAVLAAKHGVALDKVPFASLSAAQKSGYSARLAGRYWTRQGMPIALVGTVAGTGIIENAGKGLDLIDPDYKIFKGDTRDVAKQVMYGGMILGSIVAVNYLPHGGYRGVKAPNPPPAMAKMTSWGVGLSLAGAFLGQRYWLTNASAQQVIGPELHPDWYGENRPWYRFGGAYNPVNWDGNFTQQHTTASNAVTWALTGPLWASMLSWQGGWADSLGGIAAKASTRLKASNFAPGRWLGKAVGLLDANGARDLPFTETEQKWIAGARGRVGRTGRVVATSVFKGKRPAYLFNQFITSYPISLAIGEAMGYAEGYRSTEALVGPSNKMYLTIPASSASMNVYRSSQGFATGWNGYWFNMLTMNNTWDACARQGDNVYQSAIEVADQAASSTDPAEREQYLLRLAYLYEISKSENDPESDEDIHDRITALFAKEKGLDVEPELLVAEARRRTLQY